MNANSFVANIVLLFCLIICILKYSQGFVFCHSRKFYYQMNETSQISLAGGVLQRPIHP